MSKNLAVVIADIQSHQASSGTHVKSPKGPGAFANMPYHRTKALGAIRATEEFSSSSDGRVP